MFSAKEYLYNLVSCKINGPFAVLLRGFLFLLSLVYGLAVIILASFYRIRPARFSTKVISVGNITLGGTGKTTFVEYLAEKLNSQGKKITVLSRGYKRDTGKQGAQSIGDEPAMLQKKLPFLRVIVDKNRIRAAFKAVRDYAADTLILDDGLQQWRIFKDLEIVTIDAANPFGNCRMLPAGFLREPLSALRRADIFLLTQVKPDQDTSGLCAKLKRINPQALIVESIHKPEAFSNVSVSGSSLGLDSFKGKSVAVFSGIGNPQGFEDCVSSLGIKIAKAFRFADHHDYTQAEIDSIIKAARQINLDTIITTQKDAVKIRELQIRGAAILALDIKLSITKNEAEFNRRLLNLYSL
ncbi:MAG: tetraacyldisaccharide 4'-kinase [Candidatus Omnitrophica bacterium]|nr:tetraacyldisaccharide 4'-kinase [Candidatus Omnitrophota bacterium]